MTIESLIAGPDIPIIKAIGLLDDAIIKILLIASKNILVGVVTDGDVRRWILRNGDLNARVEAIMNPNPVFVYTEDRHIAKKKLQELMVEAIPVLNKDKEIVDLVTWHECFNNRFNHFGVLTNPVVVMAGGFGTRLGELTRVLPKPLVPIDGVPIVERIIERFVEFGCKDFFLSLNYKKNLIKAYFSDIQEKNYNVEFVLEEEALGTAGSLSLMAKKIRETFFVTNCDILVEGNYSSMLKAHRESRSLLTVVSSLKKFHIPYGIMELSGTGDLEKMVEKPSFDFLVNTGFYLMEPEIFDWIPFNKSFQMDDLINILLNNGKRVSVFPVSENSWQDMGEQGELERMIGNFDRKRLRNHT
jgi:dTDP-glucose pyrophosphorylase